MSVQFVKILLLTRVPLFSGHDVAFVLCVMQLRRSERGTKWFYCEPCVASSDVRTRSRIATSQHQPAPPPPPAASASAAHRGPEGVDIRKTNDIAESVQNKKSSVAAAQKSHHISAFALLKDKRIGLNSISVWTADVYTFSGAVFLLVVRIF